MCVFVVFIPWFVWWCGLFTKLSSIRVSVFCTTDPFLHTHVCRSAMYMSKMSKCRWHSLWVAFVFKNHAMNSHPHLGGGFKYFLFSPLFGEDFQSDYIFQMGWNHQLVMFNESIPRRAPCSWTNRWTHGSTCRGSAVPTTMWTKANCCRSRWAFCSWSACHRSRREFVQPGFWWDVVMQPKKMKSSSFWCSFRICPTQKQYQLQASWKNLGKSWTCAIFIYIYINIYI